MSLVVLEDVTLSFGKKVIVDSLGLRIAEGDRIGLVGPNGSGKTSLLRMMAGEQAPDGGTIRASRGVRLGYLPQDIAVEGGRGLLQFVLESVPGKADLDEQITRVEVELEKASADTEQQEQALDLATRLAELHERRTHFDLHYTEHEALRILGGLGFGADERDRDLGELSGGWKMRAVLAALLFQRPDLLLLDEPTNHLDMPSVSWFAGFLKTYRGAFVLICHDREFLNEQIDRVVTFEPEGVRTYKGNYDLYKKQRAEEEVILRNKARNMLREREKAEQFIERFRAKATKAAAVQSRVKALEKMEPIPEFRERRVMDFKFPPAARAGNEVLSGKSLCKAYDELTVFEGLDVRVARGDRIGLIGMNGAGKTTLLRILAGELEATSGTVEAGHNTKLSYYAQHHAETLNRNQTVYESVAEEAGDASMTQIRSLLGALLFQGDDVDKKVGVLSGGERARVALARMLMVGGNVMLMDEPTNHLDLESSEALAEALTSYDGTLMFVSHNRSFIRRLATKIWNMENGVLEEYPGTLDEYMHAQRSRLDESMGDTPDPSSETKSASARTSPQPKHETPAPEDKPRKRGSRAEEKERKRREAEERKKRGGGKNLQKKAEELMARIAELEEQQKGRNAELEDPAVYADAARRDSLLTDLQTTHAKIEELTERWMGIQEQLETDR